MTKQRLRTIFTLNINLNELTRKQVLGICSALITLFGGGNMLMLRHQGQQQDQITMKVDSATMKVDSNSRPRYALRADVDTIKKELREAVKMFKEHIDMANNLIPTLATVTDHSNDSANIAFEAMRIDYLTRRVAFVESVVRRE